MNRLVCKIIALIGTFVLPLLATLAPYRLHSCISKRGAQGKRALSYLMCLGGGIFFGTYLLHMGPEVRKMLKESLPVDYPVADLLTGVGFFFVLFAEKIVLRWNKKRSQQNDDGESDLKSELKQPVSCMHPADNCEPCLKGLPCVGADGNVIHEVGPDGVLRLKEVEKNVNNAETPMDVKTVEDLYLIQMDKPPKRTRTISHRSAVSTHNHNHHNTRSLVLILALSLHRVFEGMSVGLQASNQAVMQLFFAVMCHEVVIGFSLGLQFIKSNYPMKRLLITSLVCSFIMPLGVAVGTIMTETGHQSKELDLTNGILQAVAMGTFIYVTFFEILHEEIDANDTSILKVFFIALGFAMMALLTLIPEEELLRKPEIVSQTPLQSLINTTTST